MLVTIANYAESFGTEVSDFSKECRQLMLDYPLEYYVLKGETRDQVILNVLRKIDVDTQVIGAAERKDVWERGWAENLEAFSESHNIADLVPKFIRPRQPVRFKGNYVMPVADNFELDYVRVFTTWLFGKYFETCESIYEFGCGSGFNLATLAQLFSAKQITGLDFVDSSVELANRIGKICDWNIVGRVFDMFSPDKEYLLGNNCGVLTSGAIEQLAGRFEDFLQYLLSQPLRICVHIEPTFELYDEDNLLDYLALKFLSKRGYTQGYLTRLRELAAIGKIELIKVKRLYFGSLYQEGYMYIVWRPIRS